MKEPLSNLVLLGDPRLYEVCDPVEKEELERVPRWVEQLASVMQAIRQKYGFGRGIAGPQVGIMKRIFYIDIDGSTTVVINPEMIQRSEEMFELWDDCMSFPSLLVRVRRHQKIEMKYRDQHWNEQTWQAQGALSELLQHEYDHLNGVLCIMRAIDQRSFRWKDRP